MSVPGDVYSNTLILYDQGRCDGGSVTIARTAQNNEQLQYFCQTNGPYLINDFGKCHDLGAIWSIISTGRRKGF
jgi:hypothetical protein